MRCFRFCRLLAERRPPAPPPADTATAAYPSFTVTVVGKGRPVLLIPGLSYPGQDWDATVARYRGQYQCHAASLAGFGGVPAHLLQDVRDQLLAYVT